MWPLNICHTQVIESHVYSHAFQDFLIGGHRVLELRVILATPARAMLRRRRSRRRCWRWWTA